MKRILIPSMGPCSWRGLLGDPRNHWKRGRSAFESAVSWEVAQRDSRGLPCEIAGVLDATDQLRDAKLLIALPEHQVKLDTGLAPSQSDVWSLLKNERGYISLGVESKAGESFDKTVAEWLERNEERRGRANRLNWLCKELKTTDSIQYCGHLRYQLFHRAASALIEARRFSAFAAVMLVQAFPGAETSWDDFEQFGNYLGVRFQKEHITHVPSHDQVLFYIGWVSSPCATDAEVALTLQD